MSSIGLGEIRALEQTRARLQQLYTSINVLQANVYHGNPLPQWNSLQTQFSIILQALQSVSKELTQSGKLLSSMVAYPTPQFPGRTQEHMLHMMLRTRLEPSVEDWIEHGKKIEEASLRPASGGLSAADLEEIWNWAPAEANRTAREQRWGKDYTLAEKEIGLENVVTGLQRELVADSDSDEDDDEDDDEEESGGERDADDMSGVEKTTTQSLSRTMDQHSIPAPVREAMPMDKMLKFLMTGTMPGS